MPNSPHIAVFDGDHDTLEMFGELLQYHGYSTSLHPWPALTPEEVEVLDTNLILLDWSYRNEAAALDFLEQLEAYPPTSTIPIIVCTTEPRQHMWKYGPLLQSRRISVLYKPFETDDLSNTITRYIDSNHSLTA